MAQEPQRLNLDTDSLFPAETIEIAGQVVEIRPLGFSKLASVMRKARAYGAMFSEAGVTFENFNTPEHIVTIASVLMEHSPELISEASNIHEDDIKQLPIEYVFEIVSTVIDVNMKSKEKLEKNWNSLAEKLGMTTTKEKQASKKQPKRS